MNALESLHNGSLTGTREQTVLTPPVILDPLRAVRGRFVMDPCAPPPGPVFVPCGACKGTGKRKGGKRRGTPCSCSIPHGTFHESYVDPVIAVTAEQDGLAQVWLDNSFVNPEYVDLEPWLLHDRIEDRCAWLVPVRPHRKWWRRWARERVDEIVYLNPFAFAGHTSTFPAPMCLGLRGGDSAIVAQLFEGIGLGGRITG